jgi:hypothetical protein
MLDIRIRAADHEARRRAYGAEHDDDSVADNHQDSVKNPLEALQAFLNCACFDAADPGALGDMLRQMIDAGYDRLPLPGSGRTLERWRALAAVAARDLGLVKLFEGHTDALAILAELGAPHVPPGSRWGVWAAEAPDARVVATPLANGQLRLTGTKAWCSGAHAVSHALVTAWIGDEPVLAAVALEQPSISITTHHWHAVGQLLQSGRVQVVGKFADDDQVESTVGPVMRHTAAFDQHVGHRRHPQSGEVHGGLVQIGREQTVATVRQLRREFAIPATRLEGAPVTFARQHSHREQAFAALVPAAAKAPRIVARVVERIEIAIGINHIGLLVIHPTVRRQ